MKKYYVSYSWSNFSGAGFGSTVIELEKLDSESIYLHRSKIEQMMYKKKENCDVVITHIIKLED